MAATIKAAEVTLAAADGLRLAAKRWRTPAATGAGPERRFLALHGWLDNAASFDRLAPQLLAATGAPAELVAIDLPGHGQSDSRPGPIYFLDHVEAVLEALEALAWPVCTIIGHSLVGAGPRLARAPFRRCPLPF